MEEEREKRGIVEFVVFFSFVLLLFMQKEA